MMVERDPRRGWFVVRASGPLQVEEMLQIIGSVRATVEQRMVPMLFDARESSGSLTDVEVDRAVAAVQAAVRRDGSRGHLAIVADDDDVYETLLRYETRCADIGVRIIRVFRQLSDAEQWLGIVSAARNLR
jgi:alkanesulfonate monooxygenase SsuD/methylene tetrahydromethanopterin reductase-like flavin-dependent oxidoreductase (luciferase family)